jgi:hypothetical protein
MVRSHRSEEAAITNASTQQQRDERGTMPANAVRTYSEKSGTVIDNVTGVKSELASVMAGEIDPFVEPRLRGVTAASSKVPTTRRRKFSP